MANNLDAPDNLTLDERTAWYQTFEELPEKEKLLFLHIRSKLASPEHVHNFIKATSDLQVGSKQYLDKFEQIVSDFKISV